MLRNVYIKLTRSSLKAGPFDIYDEYGNLLMSDVSREEMVTGVVLLLDTSVTLIKVVSKDSCAIEKVVAITSMTEPEFYRTQTVTTATGCVWRHLTNAGIYNRYYGEISPYIIEHPFAYEFFDEIVRNVKDFTRVYKYVPGYDASFSTATHIETDRDWFNKAIVYNGQQCSGLLRLVPKPQHNLASYMSYPVYQDDGKIITFTKSDSFYQFNTVWDTLKDKTKQMFVPTCETMSIDKILNQTNMDYSTRSFYKAPLRGKDTKVRLILDNRSDIHLVSRMIFVPTQISYK